MREEDSIHEYFSKWIYKRRIELGWSQGKLAKLALGRRGHQSISILEKEMPKGTSLEVISKVVKTMNASIVIEEN